MNVDMEPAVLTGLLELAAAAREALAANGCRCVPQAGPPEECLPHMILRVLQLPAPVSKPSI